MNINPTSGPAAGGTTVTITGIGFNGATAVAFGGTAAASFTVSSATQITAVSPAGTGTVDVTVTTPNGTSTTSAADQFTYNGLPTVASINPNSGPPTGGTVVIVTGTGFLGATAVDFGAAPATIFAVNSPTQITALSPSGTGTVDVTVTNAGGTSATSAADQFTYRVPRRPERHGHQSHVRPGGRRHHGDHHRQRTLHRGTAAVKFGATAATSRHASTATQITATSPAGTGLVDVTVTTAAGTSATSAADQFTYASPGRPRHRRISPTSGPAAGGTHGDHHRHEPRAGTTT